MESNIIIFVLVLVIALLIVVQLQPQKQNPTVIIINNTNPANSSNGSAHLQNDSYNLTVLNSSNSSINVSVVIESNSTQNVSISNNSISNHSISNGNSSQPESNATNPSFPNIRINLTIPNNSISPAQNISVQNQSNSSNISVNGSNSFPRIPLFNITISTPNLSATSVSGPGIVYSKSSNFLVSIDANAQVYDQIGVSLGFGQKAYLDNATSLFVADYPQSSPRDLVIHSRVTRNRQLENWRNQIIENGVNRKTIVISFLNDQREEIERITYRNAWPSKYKLIVNPDGFEEEVTFVSEAVERTN